MKFQPKTEQQLLEANLLAEGKADFEVIKVQEKYLDEYKCDVLELTLRIWDRTGKEGVIFDSIYNTEQGQHKLLKFCFAIGLVHHYETGCLLPEHITGSTGKLEIYGKKDKKGVMRSKVKFYIEMEEPPTKPKDNQVSVTKESNFIDDDLAMLDVPQQ